MKKEILEFFADNYTAMTVTFKNGEEKSGYLVNGFRENFMLLPFDSRGEKLEIYASSVKYITHTSNNYVVTEGVWNKANKDKEKPKTRNLTTKEKRDWILKNCVDWMGNINLDNLDFSNFEGDVRIRCMKVKKDLYQDCQKVQGNLYQNFQKIQGKIHQDKIGGNENE